MKAFSTAFSTCPPVPAAPRHGARRRARTWARALVACVCLVAACAPVPVEPLDASAADARLAARRASLAAAAGPLAGAADPTGLDAFAAFLQHVVDDAARYLGPDASAHAIARLALDDLVDLALGPQAPVVQRILMVSSPRWAGPPVELEGFGASGFARAFRGGDGGLRHFALSAAGAWAFPPLWVEAAARVWGRDAFPAAGTDSAADVAANARGRAFARWLRNADADALRDGASVAAWTRASFGAAVR